MHQYLHELPIAQPQREESTKALFPYQQMTAEEYAAREGHKWLCFSFGDYRYLDAEFNEWIHTLDDIFFTPGELKKIQEKILSPTELEQVQRETEDPF